MTHTSNNTQHTPGPWEINRGGILNNLITDKDGNTIARVQPIAPSENAANARLIAAAPNMLEALQMAEAWFEGWEKGTPPHFDIVKVQAAIRKATGNQ